MKIALCSLHIGDKYKKITYYGKQTKIEYCKKHNYDFIDDESVIDITTIKSSYFTDEKGEMRRLPWAKVKLLQKYIPLYDYVLWVDADTFIMNTNITIESLIELMKNYCVMYQADPFGWINTGVMLIKNCEFSQQLFSECYNITDQICWEQGAIDLLYKINWNNSKENILIVNHDTGINQYWFSWSPKQYIVHFPGCSENGLIENSLELIMKEYCPIKMNEETEEEYLSRISLLTNENIRKKWYECSNKNKTLPLYLYKGNDSII